MHVANAPSVGSQENLNTKYAIDEIETIKMQLFGNQLHACGKCTISKGVKKTSIQYMSLRKLEFNIFILFYL